MNNEQEVCTIYLLRNKITNKIYIGQTWLTLKKRFGPGGEGYANSTYLYNAIKFYGADNFEYDDPSLASCYDQETANAYEDYYIVLYNARNLDVGYNLKEGGSHGKHAPETIAKISENSAKFWLGKLLPEDTKNKIGKANIGHLHTEEWKEENSLMMKEWHANNQHPMLGQHHTEEAKEQMSEKLTGRKRDPVAVKKGIENGAGKPKMSKDREQGICQAYTSGKNIADIETEFATGRSSIYRILNRNNIPRSNNSSKWTGKTHQEETKQKMSETRTEYWKNK
jgi:group I intron endonuclease